MVVRQTQGPILEKVMSGLLRYWKTGFFKLPLECNTISKRVYNLISNGKNLYKISRYISWYYGCNTDWFIKMHGNFITQ